MHSYSKNRHLLARLETLMHLRPVVVSEQHDERVVRSLHFRLTNEQRAALVADYKTGLPTTELTTRYGLAKGMVLRLLEEAGIPLRRRDSARRWPSRRGCFTTVAAVGQRLGQAPTSVARALRRIGVTLRPGRRT